MNRQEIEVNESCILRYPAAYVNCRPGSLFYKHHWFPD